MMTTDAPRIMEQFDLNLSSGLDALCKVNLKCASHLNKFLAKQIWSPHDRTSLIDALTSLVAQPDCSADVVRCLRALSPELLRRAANDVSPGGQLDWSRHQQFSVSLSSMLATSEEAVRFAAEYLPKYEPFYKNCPNSDLEPKTKKAKQKKKENINRLQMAHAVWAYVQYLPSVIRDSWDWSDLCCFLSMENLNTKWFSARSIIHLVRMSPSEAQRFLSEVFTPEQQVQLSVSHSTSLEKPRETAFLITNPAGTMEAQDKGLTHTKRHLVGSDLSDKVVSVCGVLLQKVGNAESESVEPLVPVASTQRHLRRLAVAVSAGAPVLLQGPVGCGKTALVEHLAAMVGGSKRLLKVQLGDQTDSKALLGTYCCTDVPGEFVWQAGSLTRAVLEGRWILLEDIDYAPMDVVSVLLPLLQAGTLALPGHAGGITPAPGFRLFATQRLYGTGGALYKQHSAGADLLQRLWTVVNVEPLSHEELKQVILSRHAQFDTVVDRLLDVYFLLSAGRHGSASNEDVTDGDVGKFLSRDGRLISTRDLMKWCNRVSKDFDVSHSATANLVFQEALDCFCACLAKPSARIPLAEAIGAKLNVSKAKADLYLNSYKPNIEITHRTFSVGRASLKKKTQDVVMFPRSQRSNFAFTRAAVTLLERVAVCVNNNEPVLLVGETGTGKTSSVQFLAEQMGHPLRVINMNQQSDSTDLLGGYKPVDLRFVFAPLWEKFQVQFCKTFSRSKNLKYLGHIQECFSRQRWSMVTKLMQHSQEAAVAKCDADAEAREEWEAVGRKLEQLRIQLKQSQSALAFTFVEGSLVRALRQGEWVLLDEINLATAETLECLSGLLESSSGSVVLMERGDTEPIVRHPDFRLFACMNPATDVGKKDLPPGIRNRFTELFVDELEEEADLRVLVAEYLKGLALTTSQVDGIVRFYLTIRQQAVRSLTDGTGHRPHYSLRTLCRALRQAAKHLGGSALGSLYDGFCLSFLTELDRSSYPVVEGLIAQHVVGKTNLKSLLKAGRPEPRGHSHLLFEGFWIAKGPMEPHIPKDYIMTPSVRANLRDLARVVSAGCHPVLLQGETSVGKTSLITWLAKATGNVCVRINNHEHTDLQEYVGCYAANASGRLVFKEGVLVEAMKKGHWVILDELNLAPTDVLEALNRLLDDNRELFVAETQEVVKAHPRFMLLATQNPPGLYGGRKVLSRAFRNRFVELHFDDIPSAELETILHERCSLPPSYAKRLVAVMLELQTLRRGSGVFAGKQGFITLRDLFRWAERYRRDSHGDQKGFFDWDQQLADNGYMLLAGRVRRPEEEVLIRTVIAKHLRRSVDPDRLFGLGDGPSPTTAAVLGHVLARPPPGFGHVVWTRNMRRMAALVGQALEYGEPVLLVGETGCGKTTVCQLYSSLQGSQLHTVNCHQHTESADFLGGLRPVRHQQEVDGRTKGQQSSQRLFEWVDGPLVKAMRAGSMLLVDEISLADDSVLERLNSVLEPERTLVLAEKGSGSGDGEGDAAGGEVDEVEVLRAAPGFRVFATMNPGGDYGKKELSPALRNRFTEIWCPQSDARADLVAIIEHNLKSGVRLGPPGGTTSGLGDAIMDFVAWFSSNDLGRRCTVSIRDILSWVHFINTTSQVGVTEGEDGEEADMEVDPDPGSATVDPVGTSRNPDVPDRAPPPLSPASAYIHGACLVFLDALGSGVTSGGSMTPQQARKLCLDFLLDQVRKLTGLMPTVADLGLPSGRLDDLTEKGDVGRAPSAVTTDTHFGIHPFWICTGELAGSRAPDSSYALLSTGELAGSRTPDSSYALQAPTTGANAARLLRALQLARPVLLEGAPGVGKTSLVAALARAAGHPLVRINLSEQTDVSDLFGADLPVEGGTGGQFAWRDGPLLQALKAGHWVVLDELNLASQSVLEGLNACLDHRAEVYVPELGRSFPVRPGVTRLFACQNPLSQGGGRKGLPRSFLNRFTQVYVEPLSRDDLLFITRALYPDLPSRMLADMVDFNHAMYQQTTEERKFGLRGSPWEFNLRDIFRWCDLLVRNQVDGDWDPGEYVNLIYTARMRTQSDKHRVKSLSQEVFRDAYLPLDHACHLSVTSNTLQVGHSFLPRRKCVQEVVGGPQRQELELLHHSLRPLEDLMDVMSMNWMAILVGPASSGKTSLVRLLAQLTGNTLCVFPMNSDMDTTELLGGFEQADLNRHLEAVVETTRAILHRVVSQLLTVRGRPKARQTAQELLAHWSRFAKLCRQRQNLRSTDEVIDLQRKLNVIEDLIMSLNVVCKDNNFSHCDALDEQLQAVKRTSSQLLRSSSINQGGQFEWVDSLLVRALRSGHWLLIDNVNFCSPSVLDRLNALLEPHGVLTVSERGVIDGQVPTIVPHPDFRLILAMDPKYGEISRAMRNRGIEIYILGEDEGGAYDDDDIATLLSTSGLAGRALCNVTRRLHDDVKRHLPYGVHCPLADLLRVGVMTYQQLQHGSDVITALGTSCHDVYVAGLTDSSLRKVIQGVIDSHLSSLDLCQYERDSGTSSLLHPGHWPETLPSARDWCDDVTVAAVRRACLPLLHAVDNLLVDGRATNKRDLPLSVSEFLNQDVKLSSSPGLMDALEPLMLLVLEAASLDNWRLLQKWVTHHISLRVGRISSSPSEQLRRVQSLGESIRAGLEGIFSTEELVEKVNEYLEALSVTTDDAVTLRQQPFDLRWNPHFRRRLRRRNLQTGNDVAHTLEGLSRCANQMFLLSLLSRRWLDFTASLELQEELGRRSLRRLSPLQLSHAFHQGALEASRLPHPVLAHLEPFLLLLGEALQLHWRHLQDVSDSRLYELLDRFRWIERFVWACQQPVNSRPADALLPTLALHWNWLQEQLLPYLLNQDSCPANLRAVLEQLQTELGVDGRASGLYLLFWAHLGHPHPYRTEHAAKAALRMQHLLKELNHPEAQTTFTQEQERVRCILEEGVTIAGATLRANGELQRAEPENNLDDLEASVNQLESILHRHGLKVQTAQGDCQSSIEATPTAGVSPPVNRHQLALWPLYDLFSLRSQHWLTGQLASENVNHQIWAELQRLVDFSAAHLCGSPSHLVPLQTLLDSEDKVAATRSAMADLVTLFVWRQWASCATHRPERWLTWAPPAANGQPEETDTAHAWHTLYSPLLTHAVMGLLVAPSSGAEGNWLPSNVPLGEMNEKMAQLEQVSHALWTHLATVGAGYWDPSLADRHLLAGTLQRLLASLAACIGVPSGAPPGELLKLSEQLASCDELLGEGVDLTTVQGLSSYDVLMPNLTAILQSTIAAVRKALRMSNAASGHQSENAMHKAFSSGRALVHVGLLQAFLLAPQGPVDPAQKKAFLLEYAKQELSIISKELEVRQEWSRMTTGRDIDLTSPDLHPRVTWLSARQSHLVEQIGDLSQDVAYRPTPPQFQSLLQEVCQFQSNILNPDRISRFVQRFEMAAAAAVSKPPGRDSQALAAEVQAWMRTVRQFGRRLAEEYACYSDLTVPFGAGVAMTLNGVHLMVNALNTWSSQQSMLPKQLQHNQVSPLEEAVCLLGQFPTLTAGRPTLLSSSSGLLAENMMALWSSLEQSVRVEVEKGTDWPAKLTPRVLSIALCLARDHVLVGSAIDEPTTAVLSRIFSLFVASWRQAEEAQRVRQAEREGLYKYRTVTHGEQLTEEQLDQRQLRQAFPSFEQDFEDITVGYTLDDKPKPDDDMTKSDLGEDDLAWEISRKQMEDVCHAHLSIFPAVTRAHWLTPPTAHNDLTHQAFMVSSKETCLQSYQLAADVVKLAQGTLSCQVDSQLMGSHLVTCRALREAVAQTPVQGPDSKKRPYDIYRDPNVHEVVKCRPLLVTFRTAVSNLLAEWPDHPTLKQLIVIIDRIEGFSVTSPLMKFVTGLEVLLSKAHEWETNAARHVSLKAETEVLTHQIIEWRKHELRCWRTCLDYAAWKFRQRAARWWFHLYQLIEGALNPQSMDTVDPPMTGDVDSDMQQDGMAGLTSSLQQFMETAPLGEYSPRLELLHTFLCQLLQMDASEKRDELIRLFWNVHAYYSQFEGQVAAELTRVRAPIEKELKGFVKIARWNDINFYAIKQAVEKTHQTLHKHIKAFERAMSQPVGPVLVDMRNDWSAQKEAGAGDVVREEPVLLYDVDKFIVDEQLKMLTSLNPQSASSSITVHCEIQQRLPDLFTKMRRHCGRVLHSLPYHQRVTAVEDFTVEIIEAVHEFQKEIAIQGPDKDKLLKDAKLLQVRKRKALADLFRFLSRLGLSYRKGMTALQKNDANRHLMAPPVNVAATLVQLRAHRCDEETLTAWKGCQEYGLRCVARRALFRDAIKAPSSELGKANVDRCQGFVEDMMELVYKQREELATIADSFNDFRRQLWCLEMLASDVEAGSDTDILPPQDGLKEWRSRLHSLCGQLVVGLHQVLLVLQCCPQSPPEGVSCPSPLLSHQLPLLAGLTQQSDAWIEVAEKVKSMQAIAQSVKSDLDHEVREPADLLTWSNVAKLQDQLDTLAPLMGTLDTVSDYFRSPSCSPSKDTSTSVTLCFLRDQIKTIQEGFMGWRRLCETVPSEGSLRDGEDMVGRDDGDDDVEEATGGILEEISDTIGDLVKGTLLVVQGLVKDVRQGQQPQAATVVDSGETEEKREEEEEEESLLEGHLTNLLHKSLSHDVKALNLDRVKTKLAIVMERLCSLSNSRSRHTRLLSGQACRLLVTGVPVLIQYSHLVQAMLTHVVASHRATAKLLSVLLAVFTQLASKGFCMPAELSEEMSGEGATQFEDIQGGGMGEGEGVKDVSDQIETEDQLDEARRPGDERPEDSGQQPDVAPEEKAIEMEQEFEGKMHDLEAQEGDDENQSDEEEGDEHEVDKQMGDLGDGETDHLDEQLWGSDDEQDKEEPKEDKEEFGPGAGEQTESELVAKDDNQDPTTADNKPSQQQPQPPPDDDGEEKTNEQTDMDEREYDENEVDPHYGDEKPRENPEAIDLPDDLNLDDEEDEQAGDEKDAEGQENPFDIEKIAEEKNEGQEDKKEGQETEEQMDTEQTEDDTEKGTEEEHNEDKEEKKEQEDQMEVGEEDKGVPDGEQGLEPQLHPDDAEHDPKEDEQAKEKPEPAPAAAERAGHTEHDTEQVQQGEEAHDTAGHNDEDQTEAEGTGLSETSQDQGHEGQQTTAVSHAGSQQQQKQSKRRPGESKSDRTLGTQEEAVQKRLQTIDRPDATAEEESNTQEHKESDLYEHLKEASAHHDAQTTDAATAEQEQATPAQEELQEEEDRQGLEEGEEEDMKPDDRERPEDKMDIEKIASVKMKSSSRKDRREDPEKTGEGEDPAAKKQAEGEKVATHSVGRAPTSTIHTDIDNYTDINKNSVDVEELRRRLEEELHTWHQQSEADVMATGEGSEETERAAREAWQGYEALTASLSQELAEQLRLVLEPTQAAKLRGDYRTGKRLNMRKVIPYVASQFRKDKIWLRRTKPSKRQYQVMVAVDDSSSMADNHSKQLAFESLAVVANALTLLEVGELGICSFGESVKLLHPFQEQFSNHSGTRMLQQFTFEQKKTKIAQLLKQMAAVMLEARSRQRGAAATMETSQLLLVVSDGRGLFLEGMETVRAAVRQAREANIFIVFVVIDNPQNKDSILDIRVPVFKEGGKMPEIRSYMDSFPFPFYIIVRDINSLPTTLSDALRQWFELVTAGDT